MMGTMHSARRVTYAATAAAGALVLGLVAPLLVSAHFAKSDQQSEVVRIVTDDDSPNSAPFQAVIGDNGISGFVETRAVEAIPIKVSQHSDRTRRTVLPVYAHPNTDSRVVDTYTVFSAG